MVCQIQLSDAPTTELLADIVEFLQYHGFTRTLQAFEIERSAASSAKQPSPAVGEKEHAVYVRDMIVPVVFLQSHAWAVKLEFGLHVHFALFPLIIEKDRANRADVLHRMVHFKQYIETKGAEMAYHPDFLVYFALPHVPEPEQHPSFQHLLEPQCMAAQRAQLEIFLSMLPRSDRQPRLYALLQGTTSTRHVERECSKQVDSAARKDLKSLLKGDAELDEFVEPSGEDIGAPRGAESSTAPPFKAGKRTSAPHTNVEEPCGASTRGVSDQQPHGAAPPLSVGDQVGDAGAAASPQKSTKVDQDAAVAASGSTNIGEGEQGGKEGAVVSQDAAEVVTPPKPVSTEDQNTVEQQQQQQQENGAATPQDNRALAGVNAASPPQSQLGGDTEAGDQGRSSPSIDPSPSPDVPGQEASPGVASSEGGNDVTRGVTQSSPSPTLQEPARCVSSDGMVVHPAPKRREAPQTTLSRTESITRTSYQQSQLPAVDWDTVKSHLRSRDNGCRTRLLQAIRWRLIKSPVGAERQLMLTLFAQHDVLDCKSTETDPGLVSTLASTNDVGLMMEFVRLMSVLASDSTGRAYLLQSQSSVISELRKILISAPSAMLHVKEGDDVHDTDLQQHALAALQKLSLRRSAQEALVQVNMVHTCIEFLRRHETLSEHTVEYSLATLMNMCLCRAGRKACEGLEVFNVLDGLIQDSNLQVRTYVHGTYYSLLSRKHFQDLAHERGLADMLTAVSKTSDPTFQNQIGHILSHMEEAPEDDSVAELLSAQEDLGVDTMEYDDEFEEIQEVLSSGRLVGEDLLRAEYALPESAAPQMRHLVAASGESMHAADRNSHASGPFSRPVTPLNGSLSRRHGGGRDGRGELSQSDSALTMRARAEKAAMHVPGKTAVKEEYVTAFAGKELARTPPQGSK